MTLTVRRAHPEDANAVRDLVHASYALYLERMEREPAPMGADYPTLISNHFVTMVQKGSEIAGIMVCYPRDDALHVENIAVGPAYQGQGIGKLLMKHAEEQAQCLNISRIELYTHEVMTENIPFYEALGFYIRDRGKQDGYERLFFEKTLK